MRKFSREFRVEAVRLVWERGMKWIADFTCIWTAEGGLYVAAATTFLSDSFSRRVVGWSKNAEMTSLLVTDALTMVLWRRGKPDALLDHYDRARQYSSEPFLRPMADKASIVQ